VTRSRRRRRRGTLTGLVVVVVGAVLVVAFPQLLDGAGGSASSGPQGDGGGRGDVAVPTSVPAGAEEATVDRVVDGDTVIVLLADGAARERVRLIGVDTPETVEPGAPVDCFGPEASAFTTTTLPVGATVWLEADDSQGDADRYDRLLRYVWTPGGTMLNEELVAQGYGREDTYDDAYRWRDAFLAAQATAERDGAGLWGACG